MFSFGLDLSKGEIIPGIQWFHTLLLQPSFFCLWVCGWLRIFSVLSVILSSLKLFSSSRGFWYLMMQVLAGIDGSSENPHLDTVGVGGSWCEWFDFSCSSTFSNHGEMGRSDCDEPASCSSLCQSIVPVWCLWLSSNWSSCHKFSWTQLLPHLP